MGKERQADSRAGGEAGRRYGGTAVRRHVPLRSPGSTGWRRVLGVSFGVAVLVGNTILIGILRTQGERPSCPIPPFSSESGSSGASTSWSGPPPWPSPARCLPADKVRGETDAKAQGIV